MWFHNLEIRNCGNGFLNGEIEILIPRKLIFEEIRDSWLVNGQLKFSAVSPIKILTILLWRIAVYVVG